MQFSIARFIASAVALGWPVASRLNGPSVTISQGTVTGTYCSADPKVVVYKSIPYAEPPLGELRFKPPKPLVKFPSGSVDGTKPPPACTQWSDAFREPTPASEDCLFINVWAPASATASSGLPVRVWIYGGGNEGGGISNPIYDACNVIGTSDAIQVNINFRLGPFGFMALKEAGIQGNQGIQDILLGLQWVQDNIAAFGGDPSKSVDEMTSTYGKIPLLSTYKIGALAVKNLTSPRFAPCVDGEIVARQPSMESVKVPSVIGTAAIEGSILAYSQYMGKPNGPADASPSDYQQYLYENFGSAASKIGEHYPLSKFESTPYPSFYAMATITTHADYLCNAHRALLNANEAGIPVWTYFFSHKPKCNWTPGFSQSSVDVIGPGHSVDLPFVFGHTTGLPLPDGKCDMTDSEKEISKFLVDAWTSMAATQEPVDDPADWPGWSPLISPGVVIGEIVLPSAVDYSVCELWDEINDLQWKEAGVSKDEAGGSVAGQRTAQRPLHKSL